MEKKQTLIENLNIYRSSGYYPYHMPGHKRQAVGLLDPSFTGIDITEIDGFDDLHDPKGILLDIQKKAARLYEAEDSFLLVNGSTCGVLSAISAAIRPGGRLLMARNSHKSAYHAAYLRKLQLSFLYPKVDVYDIPEPITPEQVAQELKTKVPDAVFIVSPTYEGKISDVEKIAQIVHAKGIPLIVDEAHGAHLGFADGFGRNSCQAGADIVIHSVHKTLPALTQTALLHVSGALVDREKIRRFLRVYQSSSPSYPLMASIDNALRFIEQEGKDKFGFFRENFLEMAQRLNICQNLEFPGMPVFGKTGVKPEAEEKVQDIGKFLISGKKCGISGQYLYDLLRTRFHLQLEMAAPAYCLAMFTVCDGKEAYIRMTEACLQIDRELGENDKRFGSDLTVRNAGNRDLTALESVPEKKADDTIPFYEAWDLETEEIPLKEAAGRYAAEFFNLYPPGIPYIIPGERWTLTDCKNAQEFIAKGLRVQGVQKRGDAADNIFVKVLQEPAVPNDDRS